MKMNGNRAKAGDLCMSDAMPWCQHFEYRTDIALVDCIHHAFFLPVRGNLRDGDRVTLCRFGKIDKGSQSKLLEIAEVRVLTCKDKAVNIALVGDIVSFEHAHAKLESEAIAAESYIQGDGTVVWNPGKKVHEVQVAGTVVFASADRDEAFAVARGDKVLAA